MEGKLYLSGSSHIKDYQRIMLVIIITLWMIIYLIISVPLIMRDRQDNRVVLKTQVDPSHYKHYPEKQEDTSMVSFSPWLPVIDLFMRIQELKLSKAQKMCDPRRSFLNSSYFVANLSQRQQADCSLRPQPQLDQAVLSLAQLVPSL